MPPEARRLSRLAIAWATISETVPLYSLYALLFSDTGLSQARISVLFVIWSAVGFVAEVPTGALADRYTRRSALIVSSLLQAAGYVLWITLPGFAAFAAGFVLWGLGIAVASGALEALLYEGLAEHGVRDRYAQVHGWLYSSVLFAQIPSALAASLLFRWGGYSLVGWVSIGICLGATVLASRLPEPERLIPAQAVAAAAAEDPLVAVAAAPAGYLAVLKQGLAEATTRPAVRTMLLAVAIVAGFDAIEEYFPLMGQDWGVATAAIPLTLTGISLAGAAGAALGGRASRLDARVLGALFALALLILVATAVAAVPVGLIGVAFFYAVHQMLLVVLDAKLQDRIEGPARATVTSMASLGTEVVAIGFFVTWALGGLLPAAVIWLAAAALLPWWLRERSGPKAS